MFQVFPPKCPIIFPIKSTCNNYDRLQSCYMIFLGIMGFFLSTADIITVSKEEYLPSFMKRSRIRGFIATPREERDLKIVAATLTSFFYVLLSLGVYSDHALFIYPYLIMQSLMISGEILIFLVRLNNNYEFCIKREDIICALFALFNWKVVFNYLQKKAMEPCPCFS